MTKAIRFNPLNDDLVPDTVQTDFKVVDEFYIKTDKGPLIAGEVWKDTDANRAIIDKIIAIKKEKKKFIDECGRRTYELLNKRER